MSTIALDRKEGAVVRLALTFAAVVALAYVAHLLWEHMAMDADDGAGRGKGTGGKDLPEPGRNGEAPPRNPTPEEQAVRKVPGTKPIPKDAGPIGKDNSR